jgi:hypothetical protein
MWICQASLTASTRPDGRRPYNSSLENTSLKFARERTDLLLLDTSGTKSERGTQQERLIRRFGLPEKDQRMIITFAAALFVAVSTIAFASVVLTFVHYGARVSQLRREIGDCRDFMEIRVVQRAPTMHAGLTLASAAPRMARRPAQTSIPVALRAAA